MRLAAFDCDEAVAIDAVDELAGRAVAKIVVVVVAVEDATAGLVGRLEPPLLIAICDEVVGNAAADEEDDDADDAMGVVLPPLLISPSSTTVAC